MSGRLEITTAIGCPMNCVDCPQALLLEQYSKYTFRGNFREMRFEDYTKAIDKVPTDVRIDFSGMCEPFKNPRCADMILYAAQKGHPLALYTTLQGATEEDYEKLKNIKYEVVTIHLPDCNGRSTFKITQDYLDLLKKWSCNNYSCHGDIDNRVKPYLQPGRHLILFMHDRAGNLNNDVPHREIERDKRIYCCNCGTALNHNVLLPNGMVIMCCMDYGITAIFGNLFSDLTYEEILNSGSAQKAREKLEGQDCICRRCINART